MKKLLVTTTVLGALASTSALAKTEGSYIGVNLLNTNFESQDFFGDKHDERDFGIGLEYKYAINFNNFFIAPGAFYNLANAENEYTDRNGDNYNDELKNSYGVKLDVGYDIDSRFAIFGTVGFAQHRVELVDLSNNIKEDVSEESWVYGGGVKYHINDKLSASVAYEQSDYDVKSAHNLDIATIKAGVALNF